LNVKIKQAWLERENIDELIGQGVGAGEIDLLSIDVDGNDYWLWKAISSISPRVVIAEYNASFGPDRAVTVPYDRAFDRHQKHPRASITACRWQPRKSWPPRRATP
jgi:hypothetical protein